MQPQIDIILLTHNRLEKTTRCVEALYRNTGVPFKLTVIDDSTDATPAYFLWLSEQKGNINYVRPEEKIHIANQAINIGLALTTSDPVIFMTNSTFVEPDWLPLALAVMHDDPKVGLVGFKLLDPETGLIIEAGDHVNQEGVGGNVGRNEPSHHHTYLREANAIGWAVILIRRAAIPVGGLDETTYIGFRSAEDLDNCLEIRKAGWKIMYNGYGAAYHLVGGSENASNPKIAAEVEENYRRLAAKWGGHVPAWRDEPVGTPITAAGTNHRPIDILLLTHNKLRNTTQCIEALYAHTPEPFRLIVIDDSTDSTPAYFESLSKQYDNIDYIRPDFLITSSSQVINYAMQFIRSEFFVFLCNSTFVEPQWLPTALRIMRDDPHIGVVGFKLLFWPQGNIIEAGEWVDPTTAFRPNFGMYEPGHRHTYVREVDAVGWAVVLLRTAAIKEKPLDENFYLGFAGPEDTDICLELKGQGWKTIYNGYGAAYHIMSSCLGGGTEEGRLKVDENVRRFQLKWAGKVPK